MAVSRFKYMKQDRFYYLVKVQYLGFRYSGWQKQPGQKTVEGMLSKTLKFIIPDRSFKILGAGRTDAKVSAQGAAFELFLKGEAIGNRKEFMEDFNRSLPPDIRVSNLEMVTKEFNIIQNICVKEYRYFFSFGSKNHPFCAPFLANIMDELDIGLMVQATSIYTGTHNFRSYTARPQKNAAFRRSITYCKIAENDLLKANFFPEKSYVLTIRSRGFLRYQVRMIMGALIQLGKGILTLEDLRKSLQDDSDVVLSYVAPGSGLMLYDLNFEQTIK